MHKHHSAAICKVQSRLPLTHIMRLTYWQWQSLPGSSLRREIKNKNRLNPASSSDLGPVSCRSRNPSELAGAQARWPEYDHLLGELPPNMSRSEAYFWYSSNNLITIGFGNLVRRRGPLAQSGLQRCAARDASKCCSNVCTCASKRTKYVLRLISSPFCCRAHVHHDVLC